MGAERLLMRQVREILRLRFAIGLAQHVIARSLGLSQGTVSKYLVIASKAGLSWPLPAELDDDTRLEALLFPPPPWLPTDQRPMPDWAWVHSELRRPGVTLSLLWDAKEGRNDLRPLFDYCAPSKEGRSEKTARSREELAPRPHGTRPRHLDGAWVPPWAAPPGLVRLIGRSRSAALDRQADIVIGACCGAPMRKRTSAALLSCGLAASCFAAPASLSGGSLVRRPFTSLTRASSTSASWSSVMRRGRSICTRP
jgi:hypothetical protein